MSLKQDERAPGLEVLRGYLAVLELTPPVSAMQLKAAYRAKSRALHPDHNPAPGAGEAMAALTEAYRVLEAYVSAFRFAFTADEYYAQFPRERIRNQFAESETWGKHRKRRRRRG
jgi:hypothetical protein